MVDEIKPSPGMILKAKIAVKLSKLAENIGAIKPEANNPHYNSKYAKYDQLRNVVDPHLRTNGLWVVERMEDPTEAVGGNRPLGLTHVAEVIDLDTGYCFESRLRLPVMCLDDGSIQIAMNNTGMRNECNSHDLQMLNELKKLIAANMPNPQKAGAAVTYCARYNFCRVLGLSIGDNDDDGNEASGKTKTNDQTPPGW